MVVEPRIRRGFQANENSTLSAMSSSTLAEPESKSSVNPVPDQMHTVTPHLVCDGAAAAIDFYIKAFGAKELMRIPGHEGELMHGSIQIGNSMVMLGEQNAEWGAFGPIALKGTPVTIHLQVEDVDASFEKAVAAGAKAIMPPADMFWGDRYGMVEDPFGHRWSIATHVKDLSHEEILKASESACCGEA